MVFEFEKVEILYYGCYKFGVRAQFERYTFVFAYVYVSFVFVEHLCNAPKRTYPGDAMPHHQAHEFRIVSCLVVVAEVFCHWVGDFRVVFFRNGVQ